MGKEDFRVKRKEVGERMERFVRGSLLLPSNSSCTKSSRWLSLTKLDLHRSELSE